MHVNEFALGKRRNHVRVSNSENIWKKKIETLCHDRDRSLFLEKEFSKAAVSRANSKSAITCKNMKLQKSPAFFCFLSISFAVREKALPSFGFPSS